MGFVIVVVGAAVFAAAAAAALAAAGTDEMHVRGLDAEREAVVIVTVGPFLDLQTPFDINRTSLRQVFRSVFGQPTPKRYFEPRRDVLEFTRFVFLPLISSHRKTADGVALWCVSEFGVFSEITDENYLVK